MKVETILFLAVFIFASLICLAYNQEGFAVEKPSDTLESVLTDNNTIQGLDKTLKKISDFSQNLQGVNREQVSPAELNAASEKLSKEINNVNANLSLLLSRLNQKENRDRVETSIGASENLADSADVKASQILQDAYIQKLKDRLTRLQTNFGKYVQTKNEKKYPKIPVYSSCVISEASGSYSLDPNKIQGKGGSRVGKGDQKVAPSISAQNPFKEIANHQGQESISMEDILNGLAQKDVQINFNIPEAK